jgi:hypothetical protein
LVVVTASLTRAWTALLNSEGLTMLNNSTHEFERLFGKAALA